MALALNCFVPSSSSCFGLLNERASVLRTKVALLNFFTEFFPDLWEIKSSEGSTLALLLGCERLKPIILVDSGFLLFLYSYLLS